VQITPAINSFLVTGETFTIVQASDTGTDYAGVNATAGKFAATTSSIIGGGSDELVVTLSGNSNPLTAFGSAARGGVAPALGPILDQLLINIDNTANGAADAFEPILTALDNLGLQSQQAEEAGIKQLGPNQVLSRMEATNSLINQGIKVIDQHEESLTAESSIGQAAGSEYRTGIFWGQATGGIASQDSSITLGGYNQNSYGLTVGADDHIDKNTTLGLAFGWIHGNAYGKDDLSGTNVSANSFQLTGYGTERFGPAYLNGMLGLGYNRFDQNRAINFLGTTASSSFGGLQYMARIDGGWNFALPEEITLIPMVLTPLAGFQAVHYDNNAYKEIGAGAADLTVGDLIVNSYATTLGAKATTTLATSWGDFRPEIKLAWIHELNNSPIPTNSTLGGVNFTTTTPRAAPDGLQTTLAFTLQKTDRLSFRAEYDGDLRSDYQSHTGLIKAEWNF
jgi:outer membrane autotransporter protein